MGHRFIVLLFPDHELEPEKTPQANNNVSRDEQLSHVDNISTHAMSPIYEDISETSLSTSYEGASYKRRLSDSIKANIHHYSEVGVVDVSHLCTTTCVHVLLHAYMHVHLYITTCITSDI